jgi:hypothetical protein
VSQKGDVILRKTLDFERIENYSFVVHVTDGRKNDSAKVNISILNINDWDPRFADIFNLWDLKIYHLMKAFRHILKNP